MINQVCRKIIELYKVNKFIETGICHGHTAMIVQAWFSELYGEEFVLEKSHKYEIFEVDNSNDVVQHFSGQNVSHTNFRIFCLDSSEFLRKTKSENFFNESDNLFFFLDAHSTYGECETLKREMKEVAYFKNAIICIDDWNINNNDVYGIDQVKEFISGRTDVYFTTTIPNIGKKSSGIIFLDRFKNELQETLKDLSLTINTL